jgi:hypothetical protein
MGRTLLCSLAGAGAGFLVGFVVIPVAAGAQPGSDTGPVVMCLAIFLAGTGAIAGAIIGGVAELREFSKRKDQPPREAQDQDRTKGGNAKGDSS